MSIEQAINIGSGEGRKSKLKRCPFCGATPKIYGIEKREYVEVEVDDRKLEIVSGWSKSTRKEFWVEPYCTKTCPYGMIHARAFGVGDGIRFKTPEAAAKNWNMRFRKRGSKNGKAQEEE